MIIKIVNVPVNHVKTQASIYHTNLMLNNAKTLTVSKQIEKSIRESI